MDSNHTTITSSAEQTAHVGQETGNRIGPGIYCLYGNLGSGKTTFTQGLARGLGIQTRLLSPTFIIVRRYQLPASESFLYHLDLYRVDQKSHEGLGLSEIFADKNSYIVIEWAEKLGANIPRMRTDIHFRPLPDGKHEIVIEEKV